MVWCRCGVVVWFGFGAGCAVNEEGCWRWCGVVLIQVWWSIGVVGVLV